MKTELLNKTVSDVAKVLQESGLNPIEVMLLLDDMAKGAREALKDVTDNSKSKIKKM